MGRDDGGLTLRKAVSKWAEPVSAGHDREGTGKSSLLNLRAALYGVTVRDRADSSRASLLSVASFQVVVGIAGGCCSGVCRTPAGVKDGVGIACAKILQTSTPLQLVPFFLRGHYAVRLDILPSPHSSGLRKK